MRIPDSGKDKSKLPIVSCPDQKGPDAISRVSMGLQDLLGRAGDKCKNYLTEICAILFFLESKAQFAQFSPFVYNEGQMNSRSPEGCHKEARQASELYLVGPSKGLSLSTSGHSASSSVFKQVPESTPELALSFQKAVPTARLELIARSETAPNSDGSPNLLGPRREAGIRLLSGRRGRPTLLPTSPGSPRSQDRYSRLYGFHLLRARSAPIAPRSYSPKGRNSHTHP